MSLKKYSHEELKNMSMIDLANLILLDKKKAINFKDIFGKIAELKGFSKKEKEELISQFYTDLNVNGHFITIGENMWGLKRWYPVEQMDEEVAKAPKKKKKKAKKKKKEEKVTEEELDIVDEDIEEIVDDFDEDELEDSEDEFADEEFDEDEDSDDDEEDEK